LSEEKIKSNTQPTVLVVDDNEELRFLLKMWLEKYNCRVVEAEDGPTAVSIATTERPDLILMDLHMPKMDGFAAAYRIRLLAKLGTHVPIIAISADGKLGTEAQRPTSTAHDVGFTGFIQKPFNLEQLEDMLKRYLALSAGGA
jgi:CheY-like chemotaxis protein